MNFPILSSIIFIPLVGALFIFLTKGEQKNVEKNSKNVAAVIDMSKRGLFILSDKSEKELIDENGGQSFAVPFGIILSAAGLSMILNSLGYI